MGPSPNAANSVVKIELNRCNETMESIMQSMMRTTVEHVQRGKGADNMEGDEQ
jgi:hypothetical protein